MSISLWDLHELVGLLMTGCLYDEVVPSALKLPGIDEKRERFIPHSSKYLFYPYHLLQSANDNRCSHSTHNPLGDIAIHERWLTAEEALFAKLCTERSLKEEVYLAADLACWLCMFVLPGKDVNSIRPSTFKMVSLMANGRRVNLAIPVLASIYEGLNTVATSPKSAGTSYSFPIHFVYAWLACYFKTHYSIWQELHSPKMTRFSGEGGAKYYEPQEARKRIHKVEFVSWTCNILVKDGPFKFVDDGHAEELDHSYFVAIRSSYLTLRQGGKFIIEPYCPHRFGCQFGPKSIKNTLKCKENEDKQVDGGENNSPQALVPSIVIKCDSQAALAKAKFLQRLWSGLLVKISNIPVDFLSSIEDDVYLILESMKSFQKFDVLKVEESLNMFFAKVRACDKARSLSSEKLFRSLHEQQLKEAKARFQYVQAKVREEASEI
ncbi:UNVERIFIED_CONTAM: hypothetical protein Scaly_1664300 [Sesamum calycinum]|uniref:Aminotransferase-like plant mobile domain-containing protein n=1 Tax=Sesamum calycinum TaxID=2727403 RepID=A0AAW2NSW7_9LAMI